MVSKFEKSTRQNKKYMVYYNNKWIHFGDSRYQHFRDRTPNKLYSYLDHNDTTRRDSYRKRAKGIKDKNGNLTYLDKNSGNYYAYHFLW